MLLCCEEFGRAARDVDVSFLNVSSPERRLLSVNLSMGEGNYICLPEARKL